MQIAITDAAKPCISTHNRTKRESIGVGLCAGTPNNTKTKSKTRDLPTHGVYLIPNQFVSRTVSFPDANSNARLQSANRPTNCAVAMPVDR